MSADADCPFCRIARGEEAGQLVLADEVALAFLDRRPVFFGHCLVIPRHHYATLADLPPALLAPLFARAQLVSRAVEQGLGADGSLVVINNRVSQSVAHLHVHVIPRRRHDGLRGFLWPRLRYESEEHMFAVRDALRQAIAALQSGGDLPAGADHPAP